MKTWTETVNDKKVNCVNSQWNRVEKRIVDKLVADALGEDSDLIQLCEMPISVDEPIEMGVNWVALGTVDVRRAKRFAYALHLAVKLAEYYKYNHYVERWVPWDDMDKAEQGEIIAYAKENGI